MQSRKKPVYQPVTDFPTVAMSKKMWRDKPGVPAAVEPAVRIKTEIKISP